MAEALPFYEALMPELGFTERYHGPAWKVWASTEPPLPATGYFGLNPPDRHLYSDRGDAPHGLRDPGPA
jgi:hypothetical protein